MNRRAYNIVADNKEYDEERFILVSSAVNSAKTLVAIFFQKTSLLLILGIVDLS